MKNHARPMVCILLVTLVLTSVLSGCGSKTKVDNPSPMSGQKLSYLNETGFPIVKEPVTLNFVAKQRAECGNWNDMLVVKEYEKKTGIKVQFEMIPAQGFDEKKNLIFASNELPDAFMNGPINIAEQVRYGSDGALIPLESLVDKYAPNLKVLMEKEPTVKPAISTPDGHIYALPLISTDPVARVMKLWMNTKWLDKVGGKVPTNTDELYETLKLFRDKNPDGGADATPMYLYFNNLTGGNYVQSDYIKFYTGLWGLPQEMGGSYNIDNDKVDSWLDSDRFRNLVEWMSKLFREKLLEQEAFTLDQSKFNAKMKASKYGFIFATNDGVFSANDYKGIALPKGPYGDERITQGNAARDPGAFVITKVNKYPEASMRWVDYFYSEEGSIFLRFGVEGQTYTKKPDGSLAYTDDIVKSPLGQTAAIGQFTFWAGGSCPHWINERNSGGVTSEASKAAYKAIEKNIIAHKYPAPLFDGADQEKLTKINADLDKFVRESFSKFIMNGVTDTSWNEYKATLQKMGLPEVESLYQKRYEALKKLK